MTGPKAELGWATTAPPRGTLATFVVDNLREAIARGDLAPGQELPETDLAQQLGVSRGPVREALAVLAREGLVTLRRHRSAQVVQLSPDDAEEVFTLRLSLERLAVERAALRAGPEHIAAIDRALARFSQLTASSTPQEAANLDLEFHDAIYEASGHVRLQRAWEDLRPQVYMFLLSRNLGSHDFAAIATSLHTELRDVVAAGDPEAAVQAVERHLAGAYRRLRERLG
ncbi:MULTISPECIES: GntR family transcriptional regulator [unclassified Streptomyces]|uniref:GntR family transcriptional regulator n=1 Tax=unclassified Streptomyces TaxID=2593676 RepID=UPI002E28B752|nr:GntR family transcriptional regulator [Streptomyces sp. NBC_00223]